jgi:DNA-binding transcriptional LysR family regulator
VESGELEAAILSPPSGLPRALEVARSFTDEFVLIVPPRSCQKYQQPIPAGKLTEVFKQQPWLAITRQSNTGKRFQGWLERSGVRAEPALESDNFDFIINLVALGVGASVVPHRALALHPKTRPVIRVRTEPRFSRELSVIVRRDPQHSPVLSGFLDNVLF